MDPAQHPALFNDIAAVNAKFEVFADALGAPAASALLSPDGSAGICLRLLGSYIPDEYKAYWGLDGMDVIYLTLRGIDPSAYPEFCVAPLIEVSTNEGVSATVTNVGIAFHAVAIKHLEGLQQPQMETGEEKPSFLLELYQKLFAQLDGMAQRCFLCGEMLPMFEPIDDNYTPLPGVCASGTCHGELRRIMQIISGSTNPAELTGAASLMRVVIPRITGMEREDTFEEFTIGYACNLDEFFDVATKPVFGKLPVVKTWGSENKSPSVEKAVQPHPPPILYRDTMPSMPTWFGEIVSSGRLQRLPAEEMVSGFRTDFQYKYVGEPAGRSATFARLRQESGLQTMMFLYNTVNANWPDILRTGIPAPDVEAFMRSEFSTVPLPAYSGDSEVDNVWVTSIMPTPYRNLDFSLRNPFRVLALIEVIPHPDAFIGNDAGAHVNSAFCAIKAMMAYDTYNPSLEERLFPKSFRDYTNDDKIKIANLCL